MKIRKMAWPAAALLAIGAGSYVATVTHPFAVRSAQAQSKTQARPEGSPTAQISPQASAPVQDLSRVFRQVHNAVEGAVVNINTEKRMANRPQMQIPEEFRRMFPGFTPPTPDGQGDQTPDAPTPDQAPSQGRLRPYATGSGVIIRADGYIATNNHVVDGAEKISVKLADGREFDAKVIGRDPKTDLAVLKIDAPNLTYASWGDSDQLQVGDWVLAFGSPFGFDQTMTQGIISAKGRSNLGIIAGHNQDLRGLTYEDFLQTDAAINPGNSGGPLVDLQGHVIGMNTAIASRSGAYNGIGFAIPSDEAKSITDQLIAHGKVVRGYLGVGIAPMSDNRVQQQAKSVGYTGTEGVFVSTVEAKSPAGEAGLKAGDVIISLNDKPIADFQRFRNTIARTAPGESVKLGIVHNGAKQVITVTVGTQPESMASAAPTAAPGAPTSLDDLGLKVTDQNGKVVITAVDPQSDLAAQGVSAGDTILSVQSKPVTSVKELEEALPAAKAAPGLHMIVRSKDGSERFIFMERSPAQP